MSTLMIRRHTDLKNTLETHGCINYLLLNRSITKQAWREMSGIFTEQHTVKDPGSSRPDIFTHQLVD